MTDEIFKFRGTRTIWSDAEFDTNYNSRGKHSITSIAKAIMSDWKFDRDNKNNARYKKRMNDNKNKQKENK